MPNEENLKNGVATQFKSGEEAVRAGRAGGIASGKSKREKGNLRALAQLWLETEVTKDKNGEPMTGGQFMLAVAAKEIAKGNSKFWELMRDTAGQKPVDKVEMKTDVNIEESTARLKSLFDGIANNDGRDCKADI